MSNEAGPIKKTFDASQKAIKQTINIEGGYGRLGSAYLTIGNGIGSS